jgi:rare lipoprotein A
MVNLYFRLLCLVFLWSAAAAAPTIPRFFQRPSTQPMAAAAEPVGSHLASWYGPKYHGRLTANGEVFDMLQLTAAHRELPFGAQLRVTVPESGRTVLVRINDRGPFLPGRDLDLSWAAALRLGIEEQGLASVRWERLAD